MKKISRTSSALFRGKSWKPVGKEKILFRKYGKKLIRQGYVNPKTDRKEDFYFFDWPDTVSILPITFKGEVVTIKEFFHGAGRVIRALPGGGIDPGESPLHAIRRELLEETGYTCKRVVPLHPYMLWNTRNARSKAFLFLGWGAKKVAAPNVDQSESIRTETISLENWLGFLEKESVSPADIVATVRALQFIEKRK